MWGMCIYQGSKTHKTPIFARSGVGLQLNLLQKESITEEIKNHKLYMWIRSFTKVRHWISLTTYINRDCSYIRLAAMQPTFVVLLSSTRLGYYNSKDCVLLCKHCKHRQSKHARRTHMPRVRGVSFRYGKTRKCDTISSVLIIALGQ